VRTQILSCDHLAAGFVGQMNGSYPVQLLTKTLMADEVAAGIVEMLRHSGMRLMRVRAATAWLVRLGLSTDQANVNEAVAKMRTLFQTYTGNRSERNESLQQQVDVIKRAMTPEQHARYKIIHWKVNGHAVENEIDVEELIRLGVLELKKRAANHAAVVNVRRNVQPPAEGAAEPPIVPVVQQAADQRRPPMTIAQRLQQARSPTMAVNRDASPQPQVPPQLARVLFENDEDEDLDLLGL
jgi:hypothetical protein